MAAPEGRTGTYATGQGPPGKLFLGLGALLLVVNHLSVVLGNGLMPEALVMGCWCGAMGSWVVLSTKSFDAASGWARHSMRRELGLALLSFASAIGLAEAIAVLAYGQHLFG